MRTVQLPGFHLAASAIGFGCASLGSRIAAGPGLRALEDAFAHGVNWFDLAPAYGGGNAEAIFGRFLVGRREKLLICSKVGMAPPRRNSLAKFVYGLARPLAGAMQGLRKAYRRMPATRNVSLPLSPELIRSSLENTLEKLGTDHLDVFALHKPQYNDIGRDDVLQTLQNLRHDGKVLHLAVSGDGEAARLALGYPEVFDVVQVADQPETSPVADLQSMAGGRCGIVTHSILGVGGSLERVKESLRLAEPSLARRLRESGYPKEPDAAASRLLVDSALARNAGGVVLLSMFGDKHRAANLSRVGDPPGLEAADLVLRLLASQRGAA